MTNKEYKKQEKQLCTEEAQKHLQTLNGDWTAEVENFIFGDAFSWKLLSKCKRVSVVHWYSNCFYASMGEFHSTGKTAKSAIRNLKKSTTEQLKNIGAEFAQAFPEF